jgi:alpha-2-macroglobulin
MRRLRGDDMRAMAVLTLASAVMLAGCKPKPGGLHVVAHRPDGKSEAAARSIAVTFDRPMVKDGDVGKAAPATALTVQPQVAGELTWADRQTLVLHAQKPLPRSTELRVRVDGNLPALDGARLGPPFEWRFSTEQLELTSLLPGERERKFLDEKPRLTLNFSQPVVPSDVAARCLFAGPSTIAAALVDGEDAAAPSNSVTVEPKSPLARGTSYRLACDAALHGAEGPLGLKDPVALELHTWGELKVASFKPSGSEVDADDAEILIELTNPTTVEEVASHLKADPPIASLGNGWLDYQEHRIYHVRTNLEPGTRYTITLQKGVKDRFGQALADDFQQAFTVGDAKPRLKVAGGVYTVETSWPRYAVWTRNLSRVDVDAARVPDEKIVPLLQRSNAGNVDEGDVVDDVIAGGRDSPVRAWKKMGIPLKHQRVDIKALRNKWQDGTLELQPLANSPSKEGVYALWIDSDQDLNSGRRVVANVTNIGLTAKLGRASGLVWAVHLSDGQPAPNVKIALRDADNKVRFSGVTGADGTVDVPGLAQLLPVKATKAALRNDEHYEEENEGGNGRNVYVIAKEGNDTAVLSGDWQDGIATWSFSLPSGAAPQRVRGFIHTDRGLYRPSETVHLRGLARALVMGEGLRVPADKTVELVISDARGDEKLRKTLTLSPFGSFAVDVPLSSEARLGDWQVRATVGKGGDTVTFGDHFSVEEYRPATFEVKLETAKKSWLLGDRVKVELDANYLYGAPMTSGHVQFSVRRRDHIPSFPAFGGWSFADYNALEDTGYYWARWGERSYSYDVTSEEAELDSHGRAFLRFSTRDKEDAIKTAQDYLIEATVSDPSQQSVSKSLAVVAHRGPLYLGIHPRDIIPTAGKPTIVDAVAVDEEGKPKATQATLVVSLRSWKCDWSASSATAFGGYRCHDETRELERRAVTLGDKPEALTFTPPQPGTILVSLRAADGRGHEAVASDEVWAVGGGEASWKMNDEVRVPLVSNKQRYRPGETARLVAQAPLSHATALVTVERDGVITHEVKQLASSGQAIDVPITNAYAPNVYASVVLVRGRSGDGESKKPIFRMGVVNLEVDAAQKKLAVTVATDKPSYRPGDAVKARVTVKDASGAPVKAEVALAAADEGVLQLMGFETPDPQKAFYAAFALGVDSSTNWNRLARRADPNEDDGEGGDGGGDESGHLRTKFESTAFWAPQLVTGSDGTVEASFTAPDNLTAFRVMAVVADAGDRFGSGEVRMTVAKPLSALPALPRFFTVGDRGQAGVVVHNDTGHDGVVTVAAAAEGLVLGGDKKSVSVPSGGAKQVLFDVKAEKEGGAKLKFTATLGGEKDAVQVSLPVERPVEHETTLVGEGESSAPVTLALSLPKERLPDSASLDITLDGSGLAGVAEGLRYLIEYPYGCLEQTTSRVVPMAKVEDLARSLDLPGLRGDELHGFVEVGIAKILRHQHEDGAFSLWPGARTEPFLTSFALYGLMQARRAGYAVDRKAMTRGLEALARDMNDTKSMGEWDNILGENGSRAFAHYILAELGKPDAGAMAKLFDERAKLPLFGEAFLAAAMKKGGGAQPSIDALVADLAAHAQPVEHGAGKRIGDPAQQHLWWYYSDDTRTTAITLSSLLVVAPDHPLVPELARGLLSMREGGRWDNTQDNLFSLVALADYARQKSPAGRADKVTITLAGKTLFDGKLGKGVRHVRLPLANVTEGPLVISPSGGRANYAARLHFARPLDKAEAQSNGFTIERKIYDAEEKHEVTALKAGDVVKVVLRVHATEERSRIAVVDRLPAGLEPINPRFGGEHSDDDDSGRYWDGEPRWVAMELHDDRVAVFADRLTSELDFSYLARATTAGTFALPPATVEERYRPEHRARTAAATLTVSGK